MKICICIFTGIIIVLFNSFSFSNKKRINSTTELSDTTFINLRDFSQEFVYDMKYASEDNFLKANVYNCGECLLRKATAMALINANNEFLKKGFRVKIFDCYRPLDIQKEMWKIVPNAKYVANPKSGSIHNRGGAVDITLVDLEGNELEMGTEFDFFGEASAHSFNKLPDEIIENRKILKTIMQNNGFSAIQSEWWHYNLISGKNFKISNFKWECL